jgi:hypothetical protein
VRRFANPETFEVGPTGDALLYREYTLAMIWPRQCPECIDDDEVSDWLNHCAATKRLPWEIYG